MSPGPDGATAAENPPGPFRRLLAGFARALESPLRTTLWVMSLAAVVTLGMILLDLIGVPGFRHPISPGFNDAMSWFPGDMIALALIVLAAAMLGRWLVGRWA